MLWWSRLYQKACKHRVQLTNFLLKDCKFLGAAPVLVSSMRTWYNVH